MQKSLGTTDMRRGGVEREGKTSHCEAWTGVGIFFFVSLLFEWKKEKDLTAREG